MNYQCFSQIEPLSFHMLSHCVTERNKRSFDIAYSISTNICRNIYAIIPQRQNPRKGCSDLVRAMGQPSGLHRSQTIVRTRRHGQPVRTHVFSRNPPNYLRIVRRARSNRRSLSRIDDALARLNFPIATHGCETLYALIWPRILSKSLQAASFLDACLSSRCA